MSIVPTNRIAFNWPPVTTIAAPPLDWPSLTRIEPRLTLLARRARSLRPNNWRHYEALKLDLSRLVGWNASNPLLRSDDCYDLAHAAVFGGRARR